MRAIWSSILFVCGCGLAEPRTAELSDPLGSRRASVASPRPARDAVAPASSVALAPLLQFAPVAIAGETHVARHDGVTLSGQGYAFVGDGLPFAPLLRAIEGPMPAMEVVRRWSRTVPPQQALTVLQWAIAEGLVCLHRQPG